MPGDVYVAARAGAGVSERGEGRRFRTEDLPNRLLIVVNMITMYSIALALSLSSQVCVAESMPGSQQVESANNSEAFLIRQNNIDEAGWNAIMDGLEMVTSITSLNGVNGLGELFAGTAVDADLRYKRLREREAMVAVSVLLPRCKSTLKTLDLR